MIRNQRARAAHDIDSATKQQHSAVAWKRAPFIRGLASRFLCLLLLCSIGAVPFATALAAFAQSSETDATAIQEQAEALFEPGRDLLDVKLAVDSIVDPSVNTEAVRSLIDRMAADITAMAGNHADSTTKLVVLKRYLYESGDWNDSRPFQYDMDDPFGIKPANRLIERYLILRRGNCITMPILLTVLGQRIGLNMALAEAPLHVFVKYTDDAGKVWSIEPTSGGGFTRDEWYRQKLPMSEQAVANGVYLRALSHEEAVALIASFLLEHHVETGQFEKALVVSDVLLRHYPNFAYGLVKQGSTIVVCCAANWSANTNAWKTFRLTSRRKSISGTGATWKHLRKRKPSDGDRRTVRFND